MFRLVALIFFLILFTFSAYAQNTNVSKVSSTELTVDLSYYYYEETVNNGFFMSDESNPLFISVGLRKWYEDHKIEDGLRFMYTLDATYGQTAYVGSGTATKDYYKGRLEGYVGYKTNNVTPFIGYGYRRLLDNSGILGGGFYNRLSQYWYVPLGITFKASDKANMKIQYNYWITGKQISYLTGRISGYYDFTNTQSSGGGADISYDHKIDENRTFYTFVRYWEVMDSDWVKCGGSYICQEPYNETTEIGIGMALNF